MARLAGLALALVASVGATWAVLGAGGPAVAEDEPASAIAWHTDLAKARATAREADRPLLVVFQ